MTNRIAAANRPNLILVIVLVFKDDLLLFVGLQSSIHCGQKCFGQILLSANDGIPPKIPLAVY